MTPESQRIAITEACGWHDCGVIDLNAMHEAEKVLRKPMKGSDTDTIAE